MERLILGVGINDSKYVVNKGGRGVNDICPIYSMWHNMLKRCYDDLTQKKRPTYKGCSVCDEWLVFSNFRRWVLSYDYRDKQLDKDILHPGNRVYSPEKCKLVSNKINNLAKVLGEPRGASMHKPTNKWRSYFSFNKKQKHLGLFDTKKEALIACADFKVSYILSLNEIKSDKELLSAFTVLCDRYYGMLSLIDDTVDIEIL